jgi:hypothetical protein
VPNENQSDISDEEEANFIRKIKKGFGKYKRKLPFKCFNCGKIEHFANKYLYPKQEDNDDEKAYNKKNHKNGKNKNGKKKAFYTKEDSSSSEEIEDEELEHLFMVIETQDNLSKNTLEIEKNFEDEGEIDLESELISALD